MFSSRYSYESPGRELSTLMRQGNLAAMPRLLPDVLLDAVVIEASSAELPVKLRQLLRRSRLVGSQSLNRALEFPLLSRRSPERLRETQ